MPSSFQPSARHIIGLTVPSPNRQQPYRFRSRPAPLARVYVCFRFIYAFRVILFSLSFSPSWYALVATRYLVSCCKQRIPAFLVEYLFVVVEIVDVVHCATWYIYTRKYIVVHQWHTSCGNTSIRCFQWFGTCHAAAGNVLPKWHHSVLSMMRAVVIISCGSEVFYVWL